MDINDLKKIIEQEKAKVVIVENGKPVLVVSPFKDEQQQKLEFGEKKYKEIMEIQEEEQRGEQIGEKEGLIKDAEKQEKVDLTEKEREAINQSTEVISKEELPLEELRVEDLPF